MFVTVIVIDIFITFASLQTSFICIVSGFSNTSSRLDEEGEVHWSSSLQGVPPLPISTAQGHQSSSQCRHQSWYLVRTCFHCVSLLHELWNMYHPCQMPFPKGQ